MNEVSNTNNYDGTYRRNKLEHDRSLKLEEHENAKLLEHVQSSNGVSMSTAVIQLFTSSKMEQGQWCKQYAGVICLVKDYTRKSYFFRLFNLMPKLVWEDELEKDLDYVKLTDCFYYFRSKNNELIGFNFTSIDEALKFHRAVTKAINSLYKLEQKHNRNSMNNLNENNNDSNNNNCSSLMPNKNYVLTSSTKKVNLETSTKKRGSIYDRESIKRFFKFDFRRSSNASTNMTSSRKNSISKCVISSPTCFKHVNHIGLSSNDNSLNIQVSDENEQVGLIIDILKQVHIKPNKQSLEYAKSYIKSHGGYQEMMKDYKKDKNYAPIAPKILVTCAQQEIVEVAVDNNVSKPTTECIHKTPNTKLKPPLPPKPAICRSNTEDISEIRESTSMQTPHMGQNISFLSPIPNETTSMSLNEGCSASTSFNNSNICSSYANTPPVSFISPNAESTTNNNEMSRSALFKSIEAFKGANLKHVESSAEKSRVMLNASSSGQGNKLMDQLIKALAEMRPYLNDDSECSDSSSVSFEDFD